MCNVSRKTIKTLMKTNCVLFGRTAGQEEFKDAEGKPLKRFPHISSAPHTPLSTCLARSADIPVRSNGLCGERATNRPRLAFGSCCGQECPRSAKQVPESFRGFPSFFVRLRAFLNSHWTFNTFS